MIEGVSEHDPAIERAASKLYRDLQEARVPTLFSVAIGFRSGRDVILIYVERVSKRARIPNLYEGYDVIVVESGRPYPA